MVTTVITVMTIHVLHAGDGYLYLIRSVAAHDGRLAPGSSLAAYYTASGQPPGQWAGKGARRLAVAGTVTEEQMRSLFGEGLHPNASTLQAALVAGGMSQAAAAQATRLGRRFPQYGTRRRVEAAGPSRVREARSIARTARLPRPRSSSLGRKPPLASSSSGPAGHRWIRSSWSRLGRSHVAPGGGRRL